MQGLTAFVLPLCFVAIAVHGVRLTASVQESSWLAGRPDPALWSSSATSVSRWSAHSVWRAISGWQE